MLIFGISMVCYLYLYKCFLFFEFVLDQIFVSVTGKELHSGNIENVSVKYKLKFPQNFYPEVYLINLPISIN